VVDIPASFLSRKRRQGAAAALTVKEMERALIENALSACDWVIEGERGAAMRLDMPPSTLRERMQRYGLRRPACVVSR
jgi:transcriptional regulator with GAF, ATPase, and Fis domain